MKLNKSRLAVHGMVGTFASTSIIVLHAAQAMEEIEPLLKQNSENGKRGKKGKFKKDWEK